MKKITLLFILLIAFNWQSNAQLTEGFEGGVVPPAGWASFAGLAPSVPGTEVWVVDADANTGSNAAYIEYDAASPGLDKEDWLVTSAVDLTSVTNSELRFFAKQDYNPVYNSVYEIRVSTTSQTDHATFTTVPGATWDETTINTTYNVYEEKIVNLSAYDGVGTVYIAFVHTNDDGDSWYIDDITVAASSTCNAPGTLGSTPYTTTADLNWGSVALEVGGYDWRVMNDGDDPDLDTPASSGTTATGVTTAMATGLVGSTQYDLYVRTICSGGPTAWSSVHEFATVPSNDNASNAIDLTGSIGTNSTGGTYSNVEATVESGEVGNGSCWFGADTANQSVWFKFTAVGEANYTISTDYSGSSLNDTVMHIYTLADDTDLTSGVVEIACNDDASGSSFKSEVTFMTPALAEPQVYYIQIDGGPPAGTTGTFDIGVFGPSLSAPSIEEEIGLSYFPNPVTNKLTLKAHQSIQNVSVFNMLGQEVMRTELNVERGELDMSSLQSGPYFVKVNINDTIETIKVIKK
jgi:hypothetical protein